MKDTSPVETCRFAPTASGRAHPGTLLAGLLAWLDARSRGDRFLLRIEDIDTIRCTDEYRRGLVDDLEWFGLDWDGIGYQRDNKDHHEALMDLLSQTGRLYQCNCSRSKIKTSGLRALDGGYRYPGTCRSHTIKDWRSSTENIRFNAEGITIKIKDLWGQELSQDVSSEMGDPLLYRPTAGFSYMLAVVADDHTQAVTRIIRGKDLKDSTATQAALYRTVGWSVPGYRHHFLLLEQQGKKLAKFHQSVGADILKQRYTPEDLCGILAYAAGLREDYSACNPHDLIEDFEWGKVSVCDQVVLWDGQNLILDGK